MELLYEPLEAEVHRQLSDCHCESKETVYTNTEFLMHTGFGPKVNKGFAKNGAYLSKRNVMAAETVSWYGSRTDLSGIFSMPFRSMPGCLTGSHESR